MSIPHCFDNHGFVMSLEIRSNEPVSIFFIVSAVGQETFDYLFFQIILLGDIVM